MGSDAITSISVDDLLEYQRKTASLQKNTLGAGRSVVADILMEAIRKNPTNTRWATEKLQFVADHELKLRLIDALAYDDSLFYKLGLVLGSATAVAGAIFGTALPVIEEKFPGVSLGQGEGLVWLFPAGLGFGAVCGVMLAIPKCFGSNGIQFEADASFFGVAGGSIKLG